MTKETVVWEHFSLILEAREAFGSDPGYAIAIATAANSLLARQKLRKEREDVVDSSDD